MGKEKPDASNKRKDLADRLRKLTLSGEGKEAKEIKAEMKGLSDQLRKLNIQGPLKPPSIFLPGKEVKMAPPRVVSRVVAKPVVNAGLFHKAINRKSNPITDHQNKVKSLRPDKRNGPKKG